MLVLGRALLVFMLVAGMISVFGYMVYIQKPSCESSQLPVRKDPLQHPPVVSPSATTPVSAERIRLRSIESTRPPPVISMTDRVRLACETFPELLQSQSFREHGKAYKKLSHLLFSGVLRDIIYCSIPKVANTSLKKLLLTLDERHDGRYTEATLHDYVKTALALPVLLRQGKTSMSRAESALKVMFVRHPFERLVSFFQDKGRRGTRTGNYYYQTRWNNLMKLLRGPQNVDTSRSVLAFQEFVHLLLETDPKRYDLHWQLFSDRCVPCTVNYDMVGTFDDLPGFFRLFGRDYTDWENKGPSNTTNDTLYHFSRLSRSTVMRLYRIYLKDFLLFGYSVEPYLNVAQP